MTAPKAYAIIRRQVLARVEAGEIVPSGDRATVRNRIAEVVRAYQTEANVGTADSHPPLGDIDGMVERVLASVVDFGPLTALLDRDDVEEILVQGARVSYFTADGKSHFLAATATEAELRQHVERLLQTATSDCQIDASHPIESVGLPGSARLSVKIAPVADELTVAIRKPVERRPSLRQLVAYESMTAAAAGLLWTLMRARSRVLIAGPPKAGKTTLINALLAAIPPDRVVRVNEESRELSTPLMLGGYAQASDQPGQSLRELIKADLRFRPDVLVIGEVRGEEAAELFRPLNAGVAVLTCVHANQASDAVDALTEAAMLANSGMDDVTMRRMFARHIDFVVFVDVDEYTGGDRLRRELMEISWVDPELRDGQVVHEPIFVRDALGEPLEWTGARPREDVVARMERGLPPGVTLKSVLAGDATVGGVA